MTLPKSRIQNYLASIEPSTQGHGGRIQLFKASMALNKGFGLGDEEAMPYLQEWNSRCIPPWSDSELRAKLQETRRLLRPEGYLLKSGRLPQSKPSPRPAARLKSGVWPAFQPAGEKDLAAIAELRKLSLAGPLFLKSMECLHLCEWRGHRCFVIHKEAFAQVRRMDGQPFPMSEKKPVKSLNFPGSTGSFLIPAGLGSAGTPVILTEGVVSLMEEIEAICRMEEATGQCADFTVMAATSAGSRFDRATLARLAGRQVTIIGDNDEAGMNGAAVWRAALDGAGCRVWNVMPPKSCKDLGDMLNQIPAQNSYWVDLFNLISQPKAS